MKNVIEIQISELENTLGTLYPKGSYAGEHQGEAYRLITALRPDLKNLFLKEANAWAAIMVDSEGKEYAMLAEDDLHAAYVKVYHAKAYYLELEDETETPKAEFRKVLKASEPRLYGWESGEGPEIKEKISAIPVREIIVGDKKFTCSYKIERQYFENGEREGIKEEDGRLHVCGNWNIDDFGYVRTEVYVYTIYKKETV